MFWNRPAQSLNKPKENSFDFKLIMAFHICMMVLMMTGALQFEWEVGFVAILLVGIGFASYTNRRRNDWHWRGATTKNIFTAVGILCLGLLFLGATSSGVSPLDSHIFPWFAAGSAIFIFNILSALKIVSTYQFEFLQSCGDNYHSEPDLPTIPSELSWKVMTRKVFRGLFLTVWLTFLAFFWEFNTVYSHGTPAPTAERTETLSSHGHSVFITPEEKFRVDVLEFLGTGGIFLVLSGGFLLEKVAKVEVFDHVKKD